MSKTITLGGERLGAGNKQQFQIHGFERSNQNLGYNWKSTISAGTLVPFMSEVALNGDTFDIDINAAINTLPTIGPLFGSYKVQLDLFQCPIRLYQKKLKINKVGIAKEMNKVYLPQLKLRAEGTKSGSNDQTEPSSILAHLNIRGVGKGGQSPNEVFRYFNAISYLSYFDIFKQYYSNKQEENAYIIHNTQTTNNAIYLNDQGIKNPGGVFITYGEYPTNPGLSDIPYEIDVQVTGMTDINNIYIVVKNTFSGMLKHLLIRDIANISSAIYDTNTNITDAHFEGIDISKLGPYINSPGTVMWEVYGIQVTNAPYLGLDYPQLYKFPLKNIDEMREIIMQQSGNTPLVIDEHSIVPYNLPLMKGDKGYSILSKQEGLLVKTYQSDMFNNWVETESIDGSNGINEITAIDVSGGLLKLDVLNISKKIYNMLNAIQTSGGTYDDWQEVVYDHKTWRSVENPIYLGGLSKELNFEEVISQSQTVDQPLGTLAGRGRMGGKHKGGKITIKVDEPSVIMGIISLTPRISYSQGNKWDTNLKTMDDFHKPHLDGIGFQDRITDEMAYFDTNVSIVGNQPVVTYKSAGKVPAWINYTTNVDVIRGNFAIETDSQFMVLDRNYEIDPINGDIKDLTTYIDPSKFNTIFADTRLDAMNFWAEIQVQNFARRKMSNRLIPNL